MSEPVIDVNVVCIEDPLDGQALRCALGSWGARVTIHWIGMAKDIVRVFGGEELLTPNIVLMCHGDERGLLLPELHPSVEGNQPYHGALTPADLRRLLRLPDRFVLNTGCSLGTAEFAGAFMDAGCRAYIGATDDPDGSASLFYALHFCYGLICRRQSVREAHEAARSHDDQTAMYRLYEKGAERAQATDAAAARG